MIFFFCKWMLIETFRRYEDFKKNLLSHRLLKISNLKGPCYIGELIFFYSKRATNELNSFFRHLSSKVYQ